MRIRTLLPLCCLAGVLLASGCAEDWSVRDTMRDVQETVDPNPVIEVGTLPVDDEDQVRLARSFAPLDQQIELLSLEFFRLGTYPGGEWANDLLQRYPWLNGVFILDNAGTIVDRHPEFSPKSIDISPILALGDAWSDGAARAFAQQTDLGPEILLVQPLKRESEWVGLVVAHFDARSLKRYSPDAESLVLIVDDKVLLDGAAPATGHTLLGAPWERILKSEASGTLTQDGVSYVWLSRYLAGLNLIYAVQSVER